MAAKGDMLYAWTTSPDIAGVAECGGAVTGLLKYALENNIVDAVLAVKRGVDIYDAVPTLITDPADMAETAGSLHCGTLLLSKLLKRYLDGAENMRIGITVKGCDAMGLYELAKRNQVNLDNVLMIGVNCGGSVSPGYGRRPNCRRCKMKVPRQADLACGNWGVIGDKAGKATFVEVCSDKGADLLNRAVKAGAIATEPANPKGVEIRGKVENSMLKLGDKWRKRYFEGLGEGKERLQKIMEESSRCTKCYACIEHCPICYCVECSTKKSYLVPPGVLPVPFMFHLIRYAHVADSCINCGQCEEDCPMEIPNSLYMHSLQVEMEKMFGHTPGVNLELPVLALVEEHAERERLASTGSDQIFDIFK